MTDPPELSFYKEHPKTCDPEDFWGQVKRTVNERYEMIFKAVTRINSILSISKMSISPTFTWSTTRPVFNHCIDTFITPFP